MCIFQTLTEEIGQMIEEWVSFVETCAKNDDNEALRLTLSQVICSPDVDFLLTHPLCAFGKIWFLYCLYCL